MSYAGNFIKAKGRDCTIHRTVPASSKISMKRSTRASRDPGMREGYWEGLILLDASLTSGEYFSVDNDKFLTQSTNFDPASSCTALFAAKTNSVMHHCRISEVAVSGNIQTSWPVINASVAAYVEVVTYALRQYDPGLLEQTRYIAQIPKAIGAVIHDRFVMCDGGNYQVVSVDDVGMSGVTRIQLGADVRA
jgi:hypothetical protein